MKKCFKCGIEKELDEFYKHPGMTDGHLNKCKDCNKLDVKENYLIKSKDSLWLEKERSRGRDKYYRLYVGRKPRYRRLRNEHIKDMFDVPILNGEEMHHWNYEKEYSGSLIILNRRLHKRLHSLLSMGENKNIYYFRGEALNNKQKHIDLSIWVDEIFHTNSRIIDCELTRQKNTRTNLSPYWGIYKNHNKLQVRITRGNECILIGNYCTYEEAINARDNYVLENDIPNTAKFKLIK